LSQSPEMRAGQQVAMRKGIMAAISLGVLSIIEYIIWFSFEKPVLILLPFVLLKGWIILDSFMHVKVVLGRGDH
jgi:hypothetical protein